MLLKWGASNLGFSEVSFHPSWTRRPGFQCEVISQAAKTYRQVSWGSLTSPTAALIVVPGVGGPQSGSPGHCCPSLWRLWLIRPLKTSQPPKILLIQHPHAFIICVQDAHRCNFQNFVSVNIVESKMFIILCNGSNRIWYYTDSIPIIISLQNTRPNL